MRKKLILLIAMLLGIGLILQPYDGQALSEIEKIDQQLKQLKSEIDRAAHNQRYAENQVEVLTNQKEATAEEIEALLNRIDIVQKRLENTQVKIASAEEKLYVTGQELEDAIAQLADREKQMDARVRLAYMAGPVSYLDVLLNATSFSDFLDRYDAVESIMSQDRDIAIQKKQYSEEVAEMKVLVEAELAEVKALYTDMEKHKSQLERSEQEKEVMISKISQEMEHMEEISEESEKQLTELAKKASKLENEKKRIKNNWSGGALSMPIRDDYRLSSSFGYRTHPITGEKTKMHKGIDMAAPRGTAVYAAEAGTVIVAQSWSGYGNCIIIDHGGGMWTLYGHLMQGGILVQKGETVKRGEKIGMVGSTGQSTGNHLHFEVRKNSEPINPAPFLQ